jgi:hypothetical protein
LPCCPSNPIRVNSGEFEELESGPAVYLTMTLRLSEEAADTPVIEVIRAVRDAAVALAASRGCDPAPHEVLAKARRSLGLAG